MKMCRHRASDWVDVTLIRPYYLSTFLTPMFSSIFSFPSVLCLAAASAMSRMTRFVETCKRKYQTKIVEGNTVLILTVLYTLGMLNSANYFLQYLAQHQSEHFIHPARTSSSTGSCTALVQDWYASLIQANPCTNGSYCHLRRRTITPGSSRGIKM